MLLGDGLLVLLLLQEGFTVLLVLQLLLVVKVKLVLHVGIGQTAHVVI